MIFSGGLTYDKAGRTPSITVIHGKTTTVLEMEHNVVDFITLCESPWASGKCVNQYNMQICLFQDSFLKVHLLHFANFSYPSSIKILIYIIILA